MGCVGAEAVVKHSSGTYSRRFIGQTGFAVRCLNSTGTTYWVLRFPSALALMEEGLFDDCELSWVI